MANRKSVEQLKRQLQYAQNKAAYKPPAREEGAPTRRSPRTPYAYKPMQIAAGEAAKRYLVQASKEAVEFFGVANLRLQDAGAQEPLPRGAQPAKVKAVVADGTPNLVKAVASKRPYIRYVRGERGSRVQSTFTAPISIQSVAALDDEVRAVFTAVKGKLGGAYGRVSFEPERFVLTGSG
ncbi:hypothetical protein [Scytonema millei]|uniref:Uncharacterized protein n=1 Tax=Scytonema millei VB511283 TaxID=1245923 RepID=A0A9X5EDQ8_9CYAN|nr:hypothetical protein [Scytonema millei]NHC37947.1 hypothetical protein [Scytonema millei VB511283]